MSELNATLDLPLGNGAPTAARRAVRHMLIAWRLSDSDWLDDAELVVSELVTNAVRQGGGCIELSVQSHEGRVILRAADGSSVVPRDRGPHYRGGYGIRVIESCSEAWGVENFQGGKRVWVRLRVCPSAGLGESPWPDARSDRHRPASGPLSADRIPPPTGSGG